MVYANNGYDVVGDTIGTQIWMTQNLDVIVFQNGDSIPYAGTAEEWIKAAEEKKPAWSYCSQDTIPNCGVLYNWYAVSDPRGLATKGWRVPSIDDFSRLIETLGGHDELAKLIDKEKWEAFKQWKEVQESQYKFKALPCGIKNAEGSTRLEGIEIFSIWANTENQQKNDCAYYLTIDQFFRMTHWLPKGCGLSVRLVKNR